MAFILIVGALFTGAGIYTMENQGTGAKKPYAITECEQVGKKTICITEK